MKIMDRIELLTTEDLDKLEVLIRNAQQILSATDPKTIEFIAKAAAALVLDIPREPAPEEPEPLYKWA